LVAGCSSDDATDDPGTAGAAGTTTGGSGGTAGKGGSGGSTAGKGGTGGTTGGSGGTTGGTGGTTGGSGGTTGGSGGTTGGSGGAGQGGAGAGGGSSCGPLTGNGTVKTATLIAGPAGASVIDATPGPDGCTVYFTASDATGGSNVYSNTIGGTAKALTTTSPFIYPVGIATTSDGQTIFVADLATIPDAAKTTEGGIYTLSASGGGAELLTGTGGYSPRGLVIIKLSGTDTIFFTGVDPTDGQAGVFQIPAGSGSVTTVVKGPPFADPGGIAVATNGQVYVTDHGAAPGGAILNVNGTTTKQLATIKLGSYPAGIALSQDGSQLVVSREGDASGSAVAVLNASTGAQESLFGTGLDKANEPGGLHRASGADVFALVSGAATGGGVFVLTP
jgi:hypothetical protein